MRYIHRELERGVTLAARSFPSVVLTGPRRAGKTRLLRPELYYFRDEQGLEVDFLLSQRSGSVALVECKAARSVTPAMAAPMQRLAEALKGKRQPAWYQVDACSECQRYPRLPEHRQGRFSRRRPVRQGCPADER
ncbi:MAG: DUF4143 domain-containing protein [bacterium]